MANVLVTGGAGFIGSHLSEALLRRGDYVICIDDFNDYYPPEIKQRNISFLLGNDHFKLYSGDIRDSALIRRIFQEDSFNAVVHLAARAGVRNSFEQPGIYHDVNVNGTHSLLELAAQHSLPFIFASSSSVYGNTSKIPFSESDPLDPISPYALTKKQGEELCKDFSSRHGLPVTCLRFFTVYGPRGRPDMAPYKFVRSFLNNKSIDLYVTREGFDNGEMARDFTYVSDIVQGILSALDHPSDFELINLGRGQPVKLNDFVSEIEKLTGKSSIKNFLGRQEGDVTTTYADISKARRLLGYNPTVSLEEGLRKFIDYLKTISQLHNA